MRGYTAAYWGEAVEEVLNAAAHPLYRSVELRWSRPTIWHKKDRVPTFDASEPFVYALVRNHGNSRTKDRIVYIGLTSTPKTRFGNHRKAKEIVSQRGEIKFTYALIDFIHGRNKELRLKQALEEIEHLLIWAVSATGHALYNDKKQFTLPGMGMNRGGAWQITNIGYRFSGTMPREIVYPWMLIKPGRDRSGKSIS